jgi:hypothetical protein
MKGYDALSKQLPKGWSAWHSLWVRTKDGVEGKGDIVITIPDRGFWVLEVKGGLEEQRNGRWFQNSHPLDHSPRDQAHSFARKLVSRLPSVNGKNVTFGILTIFSDTPLSSTPNQDNLRDLILTEIDLLYLKNRLPPSSIMLSVKISRSSLNWITQLHGL